MKALDRRAPENVEERVDIRVTGKERIVCGHLAEHASHRPHVDLAPICFGAKKELWAAIPPRQDLQRVRTSSFSEPPVQTKVCEFDVGAVEDENIVRLKISMHAAAAVHFRHPSAYLSTECFDLFCVELFLPIHECSQVALAVEHHHRNTVHIGPDVKNLDDVVVPQLTQCANRA